MAKCIIIIDKDGELKNIRVPDNMAREMVRCGDAEFTDKRTWKKAGRIQVKDHQGVR